MSFGDEADQTNLQYLSATTDVFVKWKESGCSGLTNQTFLACIQTMTAVPKLAQFLHEKLKLKYVLPGKFTSDPIEGRFGWYRQANGGNFFMSIKQLLEAGKKIRALSLFQKHDILKASRLSGNEDISSRNAVSSDAVMQTLTEHLLTVAVFGFEELSENDSNVAFYVSGYIARSITRRRKCSCCKELLIKSDSAPPPPTCDSEDHKRLFEMADRGRLSVPSEYSFAMTALAVQCYAAIIFDESVKHTMMSASCQRSVFVAAVKNIVKESTQYCGMLRHACNAGHCNFELFLAVVCNCFAKNELKRLNAPKTEAPPMMARKIRKLTSGSSSNTAS